MMLTHSLAIPVVHKARLAGSRSSAAVRPVARRSFQVYARVTKTNRPPKPMDKLPPPEEEEGLSAVETAAMVSGLVAVPVTLWSLFTLKTTGCGLPPGPGGALGALEGVSYLAVVGILGLSFSKKASTGTGLPPGPFGLLGAVEGFAFLAALAGIVVGGLTIAETGGLPSPVPDDRCFGGQ